MKTPFPYETIATKEVFIGREEEKQQIKQYIENSNNLVIYSKRRMGKSSLVKQCLLELPKETISIYCDIFDITSENDFASILLKSLANSLKGDLTQILKQFSEIFKRVRVEPTFDPKTGNMSVKPIIKSLEFEEMLDDFFSSVFQLSKKQKVVLAIDEFQQISTIKNIKIDAKIRKYIQESENISYIFLGSKRHMLNKLFEYKSPLFELAMPMDLNPLNSNDIFDYSKQYLKISSENIEYIYTLADKETKLIQHILNILYRDYKNEEISKQIIDDALEEIINARSSAFKIIYDTFSQNQKKSFKLLSKYGKNFYSKEILEEQEITKTAMYSALKQLFEKEFIDKDGDIWFIPDRAFEIWGRDFL